MPSSDGTVLNALTSTPLALTLAGALTAMIVVGLAMAWRRLDGRLFLTLAFLVLAALVANALIDELALARHAAERRALIARAAALTRSALQPGSPLACLEADAGQTVESACEKAVFASPQAVAAAVVYMGAQLQLLQEGANFAGDERVQAALTPSRRAIALDRFGLAAEVLAHRDGCTTAHCPAFALLGDVKALKANLRAQAFRHYVARYAPSWKAPAEKSAGQPVAQAPASTPLAEATAEPATADKPIKPGEPWDFPSAASIPPVNIMTPEPVAPKATSKAAPKPPPKDAHVTRAGAGEAKPPLPLHRPD